MALKNSTAFRVTTRELTNACNPEKLTASEIKPKIEFLGISDNKIVTNISISMTINGFDVILAGSPSISLNHFELSLTGDSTKLSPEEADKIVKRIQELNKKLQLGIQATDEELSSI